jgi:hypothetical protein
MSDNQLFRCCTSRREWLANWWNGVGSLAFAAMAAPEIGKAADASSKNPLLPKPQNFPAKAKSCIFLYMCGGVSHMDTFDYKPLLQKMAGKRMPMQSGVTGQIETLLKSDNQIVPSTFEFAQFGKSGRHMNKLFEHMGPLADDMAFLYGVKVLSNGHGPSTMDISTGSINQGNPSVGSWVLYGLGTENQNVPGYIVLQDPRGGPMNGPAVWGSGYLPGYYQGARLRPTGSPILDLSSPQGLTRNKEREELDLLRWLNEKHAAKETGGDDLEARIESYELAFRMQSEAMDLVSLDKEPAHIREMYGLNDPVTEPFGRQCLLARRLVESGVRYVLLTHGYENGVESWDQHNQLHKLLSQRIREVDKPVAGLLQDLKQRGLFDQTLVSWTSEMGRLPIAEGAGMGALSSKVSVDLERVGRGHNQYGMVSWLAGGGIRGGATAGQTDEFGLQGIGESLQVRDFHATVLHSLGLDDNKLTYLNQGRFKKLTDTGGRVVKEVLV